MVGHAGIKLLLCPRASPQLNTVPVCHQGASRQSTKQYIRLVPEGLGVHYNGACGPGTSRPHLTFPSSFVLGYFGKVTSIELPVAFFLDTPF